MDKILKDLYSIAEQSDIDIDYITLRNKDGVAVCYDDNYYIGINKNINEDIRLKSVLAEELGHCCTNSFYTAKSLCADIIPLNVARAEARAKEWALTHIVPIDRLMQSLQENYFDLWQTADDMNITYDQLQKAIEIYARKGLIDGFNI